MAKVPSSDHPYWSMIGAQRLTRMAWLPGWLSPSCVGENDVVSEASWPPPDPAERYPPNPPPAPSNNVGLASWGWFGAWLVAGATWFVTVLGILSIGIFVFPVAITLTVVLATRRTSSAGLPGIISGVGLPLVYIAYLNRGGPGNVCTKSALGQSCTQEWSPWPWLAVGMALVAAGIVVFAARKTAKRPGKLSS